MNFTIDKGDISGVLGNIQGLCGRRSNLAITENVLIKTAGNGVTLIASDLETGFEGTYPARVASEGNIVINARKFFEIVRDFPRNDILINEVENRWIEIGEGNVMYHIVGSNPADFPETPKIEDVTFFPIDSISFKNMIERTTVIGYAGDEKRAHIVGVFAQRLTEGDKQIFRMVSTDGSRLNKVDYVLPEDVKMPSGDAVLIPKKGLNEVVKFLTSDQSVEIGFKHNHFIVQKDKETLVIRLLEGDFPDYSQIITPNETGSSIKIERQMFLMMLRRMSILSSENYKSVKFNFNDDKLEITTTNPDLGESKEEMMLDFSSDPIEVAFNPRYFIDTLNVIDEENIVLNITDAGKPCLIEAENNKNFLSVVMPMRI